MKERAGALIDAQIRWFARWLSSRWAYVILVYGSVAWTPFVALGWDAHGFLYLYLATVISATTQNPLAVKGDLAKEEAARAEQQSSQNLQAILDNSKAVLALIQAVKADLLEQDERLQAMHDRLVIVRCAQCRAPRQSLDGSFCSACGAPWG